jgi:hypothetical protein
MFDGFGSQIKLIFFYPMNIFHRYRFDYSYDGGVPLPTVWISPRKWEVSSIKYKCYFGKSANLSNLNWIKKTMFFFFFFF